MKEIIRFLLVGSLTFVVDFTVFSLAVGHGLGLYLATALGFSTGVVVNYILSVSFVFRNTGVQNAFPNFVGLGLIGFLLTELGMYLGVGVLVLDYQLAKILVTGVTLCWNYLSRKFIVFGVGELGVNQNTRQEYRVG